MYIYIAKHNFPPSLQYSTLQIYKVPPTRVFKLCQFSFVEEGQVTCWVYYIVLKLEIWASASIAPLAMPSNNITPFGQMRSKVLQTGFKVCFAFKIEWISNPLSSFKWVSKYLLLWRLHVNSNPLMNLKWVSNYL